MIAFRFLLLLSAVSAFVVNNAMPSRTTVLFMSDEPKKTGTVKWFNTMKGYGFIMPDDNGPDIFVHQTAIMTEGFRSLADGEAVEFIPVEDGGKVKATDVTGPGGAAVQGAPFRPAEDNYGNW